MNTTWKAIVLGACVVTLGIWWLMGPGVSSAREHVHEWAAAPVQAERADAVGPDAKAVIARAGQHAAPAAGAAEPPLISPVIERLLREGHKSPRASALKPLSAAEQAALVDAYRRMDSITNKLGIAWALAYAGGSNVFGLLTDTLTKDYPNRQFEHPRESATLAHLVWFMGMVAEADARAFEFLEAGVSPGFWRTNVTWRGPYVDVAESLSRNAIKGLVLSGRPEGWLTILNLASNPPPWFSRPYYDTVTLAAYHREMMAAHGKEWFWENCPGDFERMTAWFSSESGRPWREWRERMGRISAK